MRTLDDERGRPLEGAKVLFINPMSTLGGEERILLQVARAARASGASVVFLTERDGPWQHELESVTEDVHYTNWSSRALLAFRIRKCVDEIKPDLLQSHGAVCGFWGRARLPRSIPSSWVVQLSPQDNSVKFKQSRLARLLGRGLLKYGDSRTDAQVFVSEGLRQNYRSFCGTDNGRDEVIRNGIEASRFTRDAATGGEFRARHGIGATDPLVVFLGRLTERKGVADLVSALALDGLSHFHLGIAGDGDQREHLPELAEELGVAKRVHLWGHLADPRHALWAADIVALPSHAEGFPLSVLEAITAGNAVALSTIPAHQDYFDGSAPVLPCKPGDPESIAQALLAAYDIREEARVTGPEWAGDSGAIMERKHVESLARLLRGAR